MLRIRLGMRGIARSAMALQFRMQGNRDRNVRVRNALERDLL